MANNPIAPMTVSERDVEDLEALLRDLKGRASEANNAGNVVMLGVYAALVKVVSPEVQRFRARLEREEKAVINKQHREMRKAKRASASNGMQP